MSSKYLVNKLLKQQLARFAYKGLGGYQRGPVSEH